MGARRHQALHPGDATKREFLDEAGAENADVAIVSTGENLSASVRALLALRDLHLKEIFVKVRSEEHARIADSLGATETVFPEKEAATNLASRLTAGKLIHYTAYGEKFGMEEMAVPLSWEGKTLVELKLPQTFHIQEARDPFASRVRSGPRFRSPRPRPRSFPALPPQMVRQLKPCRGPRWRSFPDLARLAK